MQLLTPPTFIPVDWSFGGTKPCPVLQAPLVWRERMNEMDKCKFNFSFWPSILVIVLPWAHLERER